MKRFAISLIMGFALVSAGCEREANDVDTVPPPDTVPPTDTETTPPADDDPAVSGYRGVEQDLQDEPVVEEEPAESLPANVEDEPESGGGTGS